SGRAQPQPHDPQPPCFWSSASACRPVCSACCCGDGRWSPPSFPGLASFFPPMGPAGPGPGFTVPVSKSPAASGWCCVPVFLSFAMTHRPLARAVAWFRGRRHGMTMQPRCPGELLPQLLHPDVAVADELLGEVAAAVDL